MSAYDDVLVVKNAASAVSSYYRSRVQSFDNISTYISFKFADAKDGKIYYQTSFVLLDDWSPRAVFVRTPPGRTVRAYIVLKYGRGNGIPMTHGISERINLKPIIVRLKDQTVYRYFVDRGIPIPPTVAGISRLTPKQQDRLRKSNPHPGVRAFRPSHQRAASSYFRSRDSKSVFPSQRSSFVSNLKSTVLPAITVRFSDFLLWQQQPFEVERKTVLGTDTPGFKTKKKWELKDNPYFVEIKRRLPLVASQDVTYVAPGGFHWAYIYPWDTFVRIPAHSLSLSTETQNIAIARLQERIQGDQAQVLATLAQAQKTVDLVTSTAARLVRSAVAVKHGRFSIASQILFKGTSTFRPRERPDVTKSFSQNWLAYQYGWKPLLQDVETSLIKLSQRASQLRDVQSARGSVTRRSDWSTSISGPFGGWNGVQEYEAGKTRFVRTERCRYEVLYRLTDADKAFASQTGFTNPLSLAWELLPFSFVVDWFLPVERFLGSFTAFQGYTFLSGYSSQLTRVISTVDAQDSRVVGTGADTIKVDINWLGLQEDLRFRREVLTAFPSQTIPSFTNPISLGRMYNALALLRVVFGR